VVLELAMMLLEAREDVRGPPSSRTKLAFRASRESITIDLPQRSPLLTASTGRLVELTSTPRSRRPGARRWAKQQTHRAPRLLLTRVAGFARLHSRPWI
jgi:hypothetical protein